MDGMKMAIKHGLRSDIVMKIGMTRKSSFGKTLIEGQEVQVPYTLTTGTTSRITRAPAIGTTCLLLKAFAAWALLGVCWLP
jgi:hypothetical protein